MVCCTATDDDKSELQGPTQNRHCTDKIMLLIFVAFIAGMAAVAGRSLAEGDPLRLIYGTDSWGNVCGFKNDPRVAHSQSGLDMSNLKFLYYTDPSDTSAFKMCVPECPSGSVVGACDGNPASECVTDGYCLSSALNPYDEAAADLSPADQSNNGCPSEILDTFALVGLRRCMPTDLLVLSDLFSQLNEVAAADDIISDIAVGYPVLGYLALIAMGVSFILLVLMRCLAKPIIYSLIMLGLLGTLLLSIYSYREYRRLDDLIKEQEAQNVVPREADEDNRRFLSYFTIFSIVITALLWLICVALRDRIVMAASIFKEAGRALANMPMLFISPFFTYTVLIAFLAYWIVVFVYMTTTGEGVLDVDNHVRFLDSGDFDRMYWYHIFGLFWMAQFILAAGQLVVAGAVASWYFTRDKGAVRCAFFSSCWRVIRYHLGTVAFGALIIAIVQLLRAILLYIQKKTKNSSGTLVKIVIKACMCCLWCLEKCLKFINKNAYIEVAIYGYNFCTAARRAFTIILKNILRVAVLNFISTFMLFVIRMLVVAIIGSACYYWIQQDTELKNELNYWGVLVFLACLIAYFIAGLFLDVYDMIIDSIFLCFIEDTEKNDGKSKPYFMSDNLLKLMKSSASNKAKEEETK